MDGFKNFLLSIVIILSVISQKFAAETMNYSIKFFQISESSSLYFELYTENYSIFDAEVSDQTIIDFSIQTTDGIYYYADPILNSQKYFLIYNALDAGGQIIFDSRDDIFYLDNYIYEATNLILNPINWDFGKASFEVFVNDSVTPSITSSQNTPYTTVLNPKDKVLVKIPGGSKLPSGASLQFIISTTQSSYTATWVPNSMVSDAAFPTVFISEPNAGSSYTPGANIPVKIGTNPFNFVNSVSVKCGNNISPSVKVNSNEVSATDVQIPDVGFSGSCSLIAATDINPTWKALIPITILAPPNTLSITSPSPGTLIPAGTSVGVAVNADPSGTFTVQLTCGSSNKQADVKSGSTATPFVVPVTFVGNCNFDIINYPDYYPSPTSVAVIVTQKLVISKPTGLIANPFEPLPVLVQGVSNTSESGDVNLGCTSSSATASVTLNLTTSIDNNGYYGGSCTLTTANFESYYIDADPVNIALVVIIEFGNVPVNFVQGIPFEFIVKTTSVPTLSATTNFDLTCNGSTQTLSNVQFNTIQTFTPNFNFSATNGPYSCTLSNVQSALFSRISYPAPLLVPLNQAEQAVVAKSLAVAGGGFGFA